MDTSLVTDCTILSVTASNLARNYMRGHNRNIISDLFYG